MSSLTPIACPGKATKRLFNSVSRRVERWQTYNQGEEVDRLGVIDLFSHKVVVKSASPTTIR